MIDADIEWIAVYKICDFNNSRILLQLLQRAQELVAEIWIRSSTTLVGMTRFKQPIENGAKDSSLLMSDRRLVTARLNPKWQRLLFLDAAP